MNIKIMTQQEEIDFAFNWIDDHQGDIGFLPANFLAFAKDFISAQTKTQKSDPLPAVIHSGKTTCPHKNNKIAMDEVLSTKNIKQRIRNNIKWSLEIKVGKPGGQHCGMPKTPIVLISEELDIKITVNHHRSQFKNKELALTLFELALDELIP